MKLYARRCPGNINYGIKTMKIKYMCENRVLLSKLFYFNILQEYASIYKWWSLKLGKFIGNVYDIMLNENMIKLYNLWKSCTLNLVQEVIP